MKENSMRKVLVTFALTMAVLAQGNAQQPADQANVPTNQKVIKDQAEYNAYMAALNMADPSQKAAAMEAFVVQYPNSVVKLDALDQAMAAYQAANNAPKLQEIAGKILELNPTNVRALAVMTAIERASATADKAPKIRADGEKGLTALQTWTKPEGMSDKDFQQVKNQMTEIFAGAAGFGALQAKDYAAAKNYYQKSIALDPNNLQDVYQMGIASLESTPIDKVGFWYIAKAYNLAPAQAKAQIGAYGKSKYKKYHGNDQGWDQFVASTAGQTAPPAEIAITPAPSPQELACNVVKENDPTTLSFSDWEYILQYRDAGPACNKDAADKVWQAIQNKQKDPKGDAVKLKIPVKVISSDANTIQAAITEDNQQSNKADLKITMDKPMVKPPSPASTIDIIGFLSDYTPNPFMFIMTQGELPVAKPPARKGPVRKGAASKRKKKTA
jgi:tetratricopeptide (TPR) repeat protein